MANLNKVMLIGRLTRDPEVRSFANGGKVASFGFAVNNRKKNAQTGQWEEEAVFLDIEAFNRGDYGKLADLAEQYLRKGKQAYIEGHLKLDQWTSQQDGQKRSKLKIIADNFQFLDSRGDGVQGDGGNGYTRTSSAPRSAPPPERSSGGYNDMPSEQDSFEPQHESRGAEEIPF